MPAFDVYQSYGFECGVTGMQHNYKDKKSKDLGLKLHKKKCKQCREQEFISAQHFGKEHKYYTPNLISLDMQALFGASIVRE